MENQPVFMLSPCGTSLLTNGADRDLQFLIRKYANSIKEDKIPANDLAILKKRIKDIANKLTDADTNLVKKMSAELNGILMFYDNYPSNKQDQHYLLSTDTWLGEQTAKLVKKWLTKNGCQTEVRRQKDLNTSDILTFQMGLSDFVKFSDETITGYHNNGYHVVFNLTGGFKSVQGFLQALGMFYADESVYIFETGNQLLRLPRLPLKMSFEETIKENLKIIRRLSVNLPVEKDATSKLPETMLFEMGGSICLSPWGGIIWNETKKQIYRMEIYAAPSKKIAYGDKFLKSVEGLSSDRNYNINDKIDDLMVYLETNQNLKSLDFKSLTGNPKPPSTYEIDAWADRDAKRIFGHYEGELFILDKLDKALH
ncbi:MAG TPA: putative CRISPR-associated protein [Balneolales bacterium]|nr:putative CRISPR-associated protein [Balneolales bacterium]